MTADHNHYEEHLLAWAAKTGLPIRNRNLLVQALTHRSYLNENRDQNLAHNERLEFLGDAVLELIVTKYLYEQFPMETEGDLTRYRAALVNAETLALAAGELGLNDFLRLSRGEAQADAGRGRRAILANAFEAVVGALYLDSGYQAVENFLAQTIFPRAAAMLADRSWQDAKSRLQEEAQAKLGITPTYQVLEAVGPDHDKSFAVGIYLGERLIAKGLGRSKQEAEQAAAAAALASNHWASRA